MYVILIRLTFNKIIIKNRGDGHLHFLGSMLEGLFVDTVHTNTITQFLITLFISCPSDISHMSLSCPIHAEL